ncbi:MAG: hypothetical protein ABJP70_02670 [Erythrobacter sp.]
MRLFRILLAFFALVAAPVAAQSPFGDVAAMDDVALADERGGFELPGGMDLDFAVLQETRIDGALVLRSTYTLTDTGPIVSVEQVSENADLDVIEDENGSRVSIALDGTRVSHLAGQATGSVILNTGNNRIIDTVTTVDLDLSRMAVGQVGSLIPRIGDLAQDTASFGF